MPFAFTQHPGQIGDQLTIARGDHRAVVTGAALTLLTMITSLPHQQVGAVITIDFPFLCWLMLGVIRLSAHIAPNTNIAQCIVHVSRLGIALEHMLTNGLDTTPCSASVARTRVKRLGVQLAGADPIPFTILPGDLYLVVLPPPAVPPAVAPLAWPVTANVSTIGMFVGADLTMQPLADAEAIWQPRMLPNQRLAGQGFDFYYTPAVEALQASVPAALRPLLSPNDLARQAVELHQDSQPDQVIAEFRPRAADRRMAAARRLHSPETLGPGTVLVALTHTSTLQYAVRADVSGAEAIRLVGQLIRSELGDVEMSVGTLITTDCSLSVLRERIQMPDTMR